MLADHEVPNLADEIVTNPALVRNDKSAEKPTSMKTNGGIFENEKKI